MIYILTPEEMSLTDKCVIENIGIPSLVLMENASRVVADFVYSLNPKSVLAVVGTGNNGTDALGALRWLHQKGIDCDFLITKSSKQSEEFRCQLNILKNLGLNPLQDFPKERYGVIIDGIFGTGFRPPVKDEFISYIDFINNSNSVVVSVDIPSGIPSNTFVKAHYTISFGYPKPYHILYPYSKYCGQVHIKDISVPPICVPNKNRILLSIGDIKPLIPKRELDTHKGKEGKILLIGGNASYIGAITLSALASTGSGASLVSVGIPQEHINSVSNTLIEQIKIPLPSKNYHITSIENINLQEFNAIGIGMGFGVYKEGLEILKYLIDNFKKPILIDADGLNTISHFKVFELLENENIVITPHIGEFSRLTALDKDSITKNQIDIAYGFHKKYGCSVVLKGAITVIATKGVVYVSNRGTPAMAKGGVGDVLSGILTGFISKMSIPKALKLGVFLHGVAGEMSELNSYAESLRAIDIVNNIKNAFRHIENAKDNEVSFRLHIENM